MDDRTIPDDKQSYAYCAEGSREICKGFAAQRQGRMLKSHQHQGFGQTAPPLGQQAAVSPPDHTQTGCEQVQPFRLGLTRLHSSSAYMTWDAIVIESAATDPNEAKYGSSK